MAKFIKLPIMVAPDHAIEEAQNTFRERLKEVEEDQRVKRLIGNDEDEENFDEEELFVTVDLIEREVNINIDLIQYYDSTGDEKKTIIFLSGDEEIIVNLPLEEFENRIK